MKRPGNMRRRGAAGFSLIELLVVMAIIAILTGATASLIPSLIRNNQVDSNVYNLSGLLEQAREAAVANNTFIWVAFTDAPANANTGTWVAVFQSKDGTENAMINTTSSIWTSGISTTSTNIELQSKLVNLAGVKFLAPTSSLIPPSVTSAAPASPTTLFASSWTSTQLQNTGLGATATLTHALEFTPSGEAHVPTWNRNMQFGLAPVIGTSKNVVVFNVNRLTGKTTIYRP